MEVIAGKFLEPQRHPSQAQRVAINRARVWHRQVPEIGLLVARTAGDEPVVVGELLGVGVEAYVGEVVAGSWTRQMMKSATPRQCSPRGFIVRTITN